MEKPEITIICKSVFKGGEDAISTDLFTGIWIELINQLEKNKLLNNLI